MKQSSKETEVNRGKRNLVTGQERGRARGRGGLACGLVGLLLWIGAAVAQTNQPPPLLNPASLQWPRFFATNGYEFAVYQPQIAKWPGNQLEGRFAIAVRPAGTSNETY